MFTITKIFKFSAAHYIGGLAENHKCSRVHGHNYEVHFTFQSRVLDEQGFILDVSQLDRIKMYISDDIDHRILNDVFEFSPSSENLAHHFYFYAKNICLLPISNVTVKETNTIYASYSENAI